MLTARVADSDKILGLTIGADDYITKALQPAGGRRAGENQFAAPGATAAAPEDAAEYDIRGLIINRESHKCTLFGRELVLTPIEFFDPLVSLLAAGTGRAVRGAVRGRVEGENICKTATTPSWRTSPGCAKKMNEPPRNPKFIKTVWG